MAGIVKTSSWPSSSGLKRKASDALDEVALKRSQALRDAQKAAALKRAEQKVGQLRDPRSGQAVSSHASASSHGHSHSHSSHSHHGHGSHGHISHSSSGLSKSQSHGSLQHSNSKTSVTSERPNYYRSSSGELICRKCRQKYDPRYKLEFKDGYCLKCRKRAKEKAAALQKEKEKAAEKKATAQQERGRMAAAPAPKRAQEQKPSYHRNQSALICCKCQQSSNLRRIPDLKDGTFLCPSCRLREMDPFNTMRENEKGLLKLMLLQPPTLPEDTCGEATIRIKLNMPNLAKWRKAGEEIDVRMLNLDCCDTQQSWPHSLTMWANGTQAFQVEAPKEGHKRRDAPQRISACLKSDMVNELKISMRDGFTLQRFGMAIVRVKPQSVLEMRKAVRLISAEDGRKQVREVLWNSKLLSLSEEVETDGSDRCRLTCPLTHQRIHTPVRGEKCAHLQCFDLKAYLEINRGIAAFNKRWTCPVCAMTAKPADMFVDMYMLNVLKKTEEDDDEICFDQDGEWTVTAKVPPPPTPDTDMEAAEEQEDTTPEILVVPEEGLDDE